MPEPRNQPARRGRSWWTQKCVVTRRAINAQLAKSDKMSFTAHQDVRRKGK
ncbi:MAG TPA: hypothetical protein VF996_03355 [Candidatus Saccharimonadales bacterium]